MKDVKFRKHTHENISRTSQRGNLAPMEALEENKFAEPSTYIPGEMYNEN